MLLFFTLPFVTSFLFANAQYSYSDVEIGNVSAAYSNNNDTYQYQIKVGVGCSPITYYSLSLAFGHRLTDQTQLYKYGQYTPTTCTTSVPPGPVNQSDGNIIARYQDRLTYKNLITLSHESITTFIDHLPFNVSKFQPLTSVTRHKVPPGVSGIVTAHELAINTCGEAEFGLYLVSPLVAKSDPEDPDHYTTSRLAVCDYSDVLRLGYMGKNGTKVPAVYDTNKLFLAGFSRSSLKYGSVTLPVPPVDAINAGQQFYLSDTSRTIQLAKRTYQAYVNLTGAALAPNGYLQITDAQYNNLKNLYLTVNNRSLTISRDAQIYPRKLNAAIGGTPTGTYLAIKPVPNGGDSYSILGVPFYERFYVYYKGWNSTPAGGFEHNNYAPLTITLTPTKYTTGIFNHPLS